MTKTQSPTLVTLGRTVRTFRDAAGLTQQNLGDKLGYTNGWVSNLEMARLRPRTDQVVAIEQALELPRGALLNLYEQLDAEILPGWFREWVDEESRASVIRTYQLALVPGLLQTEEYIRALLRGDEQAIIQRFKRQGILADEKAPTLHVVLDEAVLYRERGGPEIMRAQLEHLIASVGPKLTLQVVRSGMNPRQTGAFTIATVDGADVGYVETIIRGIVTSSCEDLAELSAAWETIRSFALSQHESVQLIEKVTQEKWT